jgi:hypothetical protein
VNDGEGSGIFAGVESGEGAKEGPDGVLAGLPEGEAIVVDIEVDVLAHDGLVHFAGVDLYVVGECRVVGESIFEAFADQAIYFGGERGGGG